MVWESPGHHVVANSEFFLQLMLNHYNIFAISDIIKSRILSYTASNLSQGWPPAAACTKWVSRLLNSPAVLPVERPARVISDSLLLHFYEIQPSSQSTDILAQLLICSLSVTTGVQTCPDIPGLSSDAESAQRYKAYVLRWAPFQPSIQFLDDFHCSFLPTLKHCSTWRSSSWSLRAIVLSWAQLLLL